MAIWEEKIECCPREELQQLQLERLQSSLNRAYKNVSFYRKIFDEKKIVPEDISTLEEFKHLPLTTKQDLQNNYPYGLFAVPLREVVRIHTTTETIDTPTVIGYTRNDLKNWGTQVARFLTAGGVTHDDVMQISFHYGLFTGAFGLHHGAECIGASVIPGIQRKYRSPDQDHAGLPDHGAGGNAVLCSDFCRPAAKTGHRPENLKPQERPVRG